MNKIKFTICDAIFNEEKKVMNFPKVGDFNLTLEQMRDTIKDSIDQSFEEMKNDLENSNRQASTGIVFMPYLKVFWDDQENDDLNLEDDEALL